jgi:hypothetical protein
MRNIQKEEYEEPGARREEEKTEAEKQNPTPSHNSDKKTKKAGPSTRNTE